MRSAHLGMVVSKYREGLNSNKIFGKGYDGVGKEDLGKGCWNPKTKLRVITKLAEIIKLQFGEKACVNDCHVFQSFLELL